MFASKDLFFTNPSSGGYSISKSVRLRSSASAYLNRTFGSAGNVQTYTISFWIKRGILSTTEYLFVGFNGSVSSQISFNSSDQLILNVDGGNGYQLITSAVYRDPSSWYHIVATVDTTQATSSNRLKLYVNGVQITSFGTASYPPQNSNTYFFGATGHWIGSSQGPSQYFDGYLTEFNAVNGQALTASSFGAFNATTGVWQPIKYAGTYGTNGFYLNFSNNASTTTLGYDTSGNGNNWTTNNISLTAGSTYDSMTDVPTLTSATAANFCTLNPLITYSPASSYLSSANTVLYYANTSLWISSGGTMAISSGKYYWEITTTNIANPSDAMIGIASVTETSSFLPSNYFTGQGANSYGYYSANGNKYNNGSASAYGSAYGNVVIGVALDMNAGTLTFYVNNTSQGVAFSGLSGTFTPAVSSKSGIPIANFGQQPFTYTPPTGYVALNTYNLPTPTIKNGAAYMAATLYTGTNANLTVSNSTNNTIGTTFQPDFVWIKDRTNAYASNLVDSIRGSHGVLISSSTAAEATSTGTTGVLSFNSNGFSLGLDTSTSGATNTNTDAFVAWQWKAGGTSSSNTNGSITSTVSVNATAGFSVVTYTGTGSNATVGHGLGVTPSLIICKNRSGAFNWTTWFTSFSGTQFIQLNTTTAVQSASTPWNSTTPTSTVFSVGADSSTNGSTNNQVAYCFAPIKGYSAFGSYTGNGSTDGPFVYLGFRPRFVLWKRTDTANDWIINDTSRDTYNAMQLNLLSDSSQAESTAVHMDALSNGFKVRASSLDVNASGGTYIYACFAENPFNYSLAR